MNGYRRHSLKMLMERLAPIVGDIEWTDFTAYGNEGNKLEAGLSAGQAALGKAYLMARDALERDDTINDFVLLEALALERQGMNTRAANIFHKQAESVIPVMKENEAATKARKNGGDRRGQQQAAVAAAEWKPYLDAYDRLLADGKSRKDAIRKIGFEITNDGFVLSSTGNPPSKKAIYKRLHKK